MMENFVVKKMQMYYNKGLIVVIWVLELLTHFPSLPRLYKNLFARTTRQKSPGSMLLRLPTYPPDEEWVLAFIITFVILEFSYIPEKKPFLNLSKSKQPNSQAT